MTRIALRGLAARKLRAALTATAVLLGVTMIAGTYVFTDTIDRAFTQIFTDAARGADAVVSGRQVVRGEFSTPPSVPVSLIARIRELPEVATAAGQVSDVAALVGADGKVVKRGGAPTIAASYMPPPFQALEIVQGGRPPRGPREIAVDEGTARREGLEIGDRLQVATDQPRRTFTVVGLTRFGGTSLGGATFVVFDLPTAQRLFSKPGRVDFISVAARAGVSERDLVRAIRPLLPREIQVRTASQQVRHDVGSLDLGILTAALLAFGLIAVFVGGFVIFNTFSITVAQRTREFALLRMLGATRRQVLGAVVAEALLIGVLGSAAGLGLGLLTAQGIDALFTALGIDLPTTAPVFRARTAIVGPAVGIGVTLLAALGPGLRATRVPPIAALRDGLPARRSRLGRLRPVLATLLGAGGAALLASGLLADSGTTDSRLARSAGGAIVLVLGIGLLSPALVRPLARAAGWPLERSTALVGRLARENAVRNPGRTAVTASALMIGLALVLFVTVFANGLRETTDRLVDRTLIAEYAIYHEDSFSPIPARAADAVARVPGVAIVSPIKTDSSRLAGAGEQSANGIDPATIRSVYRFDVVKGPRDAVRGLRGGEVVVEERAASRGGIEVGDRVRAQTPAGAHVRLRVRAIYKDEGLLGGYSMRLADFDRLFSQKRLSVALVRLAPGADARAVETGMARALRAFPEARARSQEKLKQEQAAQIDQILALFSALLAMSIVVSLFGIVNTLTLSIYERTRELGLLRAVGMSRRQVRRLVRYESVITALIGAGLGLGLGLFFAWIVTRAVEEEGIVFAIPWVRLAVFLIVAALAGVAAAVLPARRAARLDVLQAVAYE